MHIPQNFSWIEIAVSSMLLKALPADSSALKRFCYAQGLFEKLLVALNALFANKKPPCVQRRFLGTQHFFD